mmetsp:Transcript_51786/g.144705  ORF Transcript_51786/g.144705 Transcript_51786/m.144705 type:complete len:271 (+) Transcript_51786:230-1042(+)
MDDGLRRVQALGATVGAIHDAMASVELHGVVDPRQALLRVLVPRVCDPAVRLHQNGGSQVVLGVPPVGGAGGHAASAKDALVHAVKLRPVLPCLEVLPLAVGLDVLPLEPGLDGLVLVVEVGEVRYEIFDDVGVGQRLDLDSRITRLNVKQAREAVLPVDVHRARTADSFPAGPPEGERGVNFVLDFDECVQDHRATTLQVDGVLLEEGLCGLVGIVSVDRKLLRGRGGCEATPTDEARREARHPRRQGGNARRQHRPHHGRGGKSETTK